MFWYIVAAIVGIAIIAGLISQVTSRFVVWSYQAGVKFSNGRYVGTLKPGAYWISPAFTKIMTVDMRQRFQTVEGQEVLSLDGVSLRVSLAVQFGIADPHLAITQTEGYEKALYLVVQVALREVLSAQPIDDLLANRGEIGPRVLALAAPSAQQMGLSLQSVSVKDIMFPGPLKSTMARVVEARKESEAALERARGEAATLRSLANTARLLDKDPSLMQLRMLQTFAETKGNTLILNMSGSAPTVEVSAKPLPPG
jgi:regulator of protease activity HflC (stomatin/prohibitin superfamily)